jgi:hypothetical protein
MEYCTRPDKCVAVVVSVWARAAQSSMDPAAQSDQIAREDDHSVRMNEMQQYRRLLPGLGLENACNSVL